ncbi:MAG TPA: hypothetical protein P5077_01330 [bacterium]|nr:hypothetical protein [bacterium]
MKSLPFFFLALLIATPTVFARSKVLILPPAWESSSLKNFAQDMDENCDDLLPAIKNADGYCAATALPLKQKKALSACKGKYACLKKKARSLEEYDILVLSSLSRKKGVPFLRVTFYNTRGDLLHREDLRGDRNADPEETAALYLTALRNAHDLFARPANPYEVKEALRRGFTFYKKGDIGQTLRFFEKAGDAVLLGLTGEVDALLARAKASIERGEVRDALGDLQTALEKDENIRKSGFKVISYIRETEKTKRSEFDQNDFYDDLLKIHSEFERRFRDIEKTRAGEERAIAAREKKAIEAVEYEIEQARQDIEKKEAAMDKRRAVVDEEIRKLLEKQETELRLLEKKKDILRKRIESLEQGRKEFIDKVEQRADELKNNDLEKLQSRFLKEQENISKKISALESKDPPDGKAITALEKKLTAIEADLEKKQAALTEQYRRGANEHLTKYDRKVDEVRKQLSKLEKNDASLVKGYQDRIAKKEAGFKQQVAQWHKEREKRERLIDALIKNSEKRVAAAGREAQRQREQLKKQLNTEKEKVIIDEKEKITKRYTARFKPVFNRVIERTAATKKINALLGTAYAMLGDRSLKDDDLPEARRHYHRALYHDPANKQAAKGIDLIRARTVKLYETAIAMSGDEPDKARQTLETIINSLKPTNPVYIRSFVALKELSN